MRWVFGRRSLQHTARVWLGIASLWTCAAVCSCSSNDGGSGSAGAGGGGQAAPGTENGFCNPPSGSCAACQIPECNAELACYPVGPGANGNYGTCLPRGGIGDSCHVWNDSDTRGTCGSGTGANLSCCQVNGSTGTCFAPDDPACAGPSKCDQCLQNCRGLSNCCTGTGCICDSVC